MPDSQINDRQRRAYDVFKAASSRAEVPGLELPAGTPSPAQLGALVLQAKGAIAKAAAAQDSEIERLMSTISDGGARRTAESEAAWRRLDSACSKLETELRSPSSMRTRLDEGRRSMMPKVEALIQESLTPEVTRQRGNLVASIAPEGLRALEAQLPQWVEGWGRYTCTWLDHDLQRALEELWQPREGDMPLPPPRFEPLGPKVSHKNIELPTLTLQRDQLKLGSGMYRHGRSIIYGFMSIIFLIARFGGGPSSGLSGAKGVLLGFLLVPSAIGFGYYQVLSERTKERARLADELGKKAEQAVRDAVRTWMERAADRLAEDVRVQLFDRRRAFVQWYRRQVMPALESQQRGAAERDKQVAEARADLQKVQNAKRETERLAGELGRLAAVVG